MDSYCFPCAKLTPPEQLPPADRPLAVIATCGSYNPIHSAHIQMFECAKSKLESDGVFVVGAFLSPVNDAYKKAGLAPFPDRLAICEAALADHPWLAVDPWEGLQSDYIRSFYVLEHIITEVRNFYKRPEIRVYFLCGGDLFETFYRPGCWELRLLEKIFKSFYLVVITREGSKDPLEVVKSATQPLTHADSPGVELDLNKYVDKVVCTLLAPPNNASSTKVRAALKAGDPLGSDMVPPAAMKYLVEHKMYLE